MSGWWEYPGGSRIAAGSTVYIDVDDIDIKIEVTHSITGTSVFRSHKLEDVTWTPSGPCKGFYKVRLKEAGFYVLPVECCRLVPVAYLPRPVLLAGFHGAQYYDEVVSVTWFATGTEALQ